MITVKVNNSTSIIGMTFFFFLGFLVVAVYGNVEELYNADALIKEVNDANTTWTAGHNFPKDISLQYIKYLLGSTRIPPRKNIPVRNLSFSKKYVDIPNTFDAREHWPHCPTIRSIQDQGGCGSCWAVSAAATFSDRLCIATNGSFTKPLSAHQLLTCCSECGAGCEGGAAEPAWDYFRDHGLVTGGNYNSNDGCQPYQFQPCQHHNTGSRPDCESFPDPMPTPSCQENCHNQNYTTIFREDLYKTKSTYAVQNVFFIQLEILQHGPVQAAFRIYTDFLNYKSGVYKHVSKQLLFAHSIRIIGWGNENGTPYWLVANSWNSDWGDNGTFKILRGYNECEIEAFVISGIPDV